MGESKKKSGRRRRVWRGVLIVVGSVALLVGGMAWVAWPFVMARPMAKDPALLGRLAALAPVEEGPNRWNEFSALLERELGHNGRDFAVGSPGGALRRPHGWNDLTVRGWGDPAMDTAVGALAGVEGPLWRLDALLAEGHAAPVLRRDREFFATGPDEAVSWRSVSSLSGTVGTLARMNAGAMRAAAERCDWPAFERSLRLALRLPRILRADPDPEERMMEWASLAAGMGEARRLLDEHEVPPEVCVRALAALTAEEPRWQWYSVERCGEAWALIAGDRARVWFLDSGAANLVRFDRSRRDDMPWVNDSARLDDPAAWPERLANVRAIAYLSWDEAAARIEQQREESVRSALGGDAAEDAARLDAFIDGMDDDEEGSTDWPAEFELWVMPPPAGMAIYARTLDLAAADLRALDLALRLECHRAMHGRWPEALTEAMSPERTIERSSGEPMVYVRLLDDEPGRGYELRAPQGASFVRVGLDGRPGRNPDGWVMNSPRAHHELGWERDRREYGQ